MKVIRRRDYRVLDAEVVRPGSEASLPVLLIDGEPFPPQETVGYYLLEAADHELGELRRGGYTLLREISRAS
jgi:hypothetical protein